jgi:hypothetical protein
MTNKTLLRDMFGLLISPLRNNTTITSSSEQNQLVLTESNNKLVLYSNPTNQSTLDSITQDSSTISSISEAFPDLPEVLYSYTRSYIKDNFSEDSLINLEESKTHLFFSSSSGLRHPQIEEISKKFNDFAIEQK